jgi:hypothetical protein
MKIALRKGPATDASTVQRLASDYIRLRLATEWPHAGVVIRGTLYHASGSVGLADVPFTEHRWDLIDIGDEHDEEALQIFRDLRAQGAGYDWIELLDFSILRGALKLASRNAKVKRWLDLNVYCYFLALWMASLKKPSRRVTAESLLWFALTKVAPSSVQPSTP